MDFAEFQSNGNWMATEAPSHLAIRQEIIIATLPLAEEKRL
jgi:hypothetical protein